jgi:hypothetical protein
MNETFEYPWASRVRAMEALAEFLLARIAEDEAISRGVAEPLSPDETFDVRFRTYESDHTQGDSAHVRRFDPARVLAECEAKRRIIEQSRRWLDDGEGGETVATEALLQFGTVYADHPDYRQEWKP